MTEILTAPGAQAVWCQDISSLISQRTCFKLNNKCVLGLGSLLYVLASLAQGKSAVVSRENADGYPLSSAPPQWDGGDQSDSSSFSLSTHLEPKSARKTQSIDAELFQLALTWNIRKTQMNPTHMGHPPSQSGPARPWSRGAGISHAAVKVAMVDVPRPDFPPRWKSQDGLNLLRRHWSKPGSSERFMFWSPLLAF